MKNEEPITSKIFENLIPIEPEEFHRAFEIAMNATTDTSEELDPTKKKFYLEEEDGSVNEYAITDRPMARATLAMAKLYEHESEKYHSVNMRIFALLNIVQDKDLDKWRKKIPGGYDIHDAIVDAAATVELTSEGEFPKAEFIKTVEKIIQEKYSE